ELRTEPAATGGSTIRNIAEALPMRTARQQTDLVQTREAIHWPAVKKARRDRSLAKKEMLQTAQAPVAPAILVVVELAPGRWVPEAALPVPAVVVPVPAPRLARILAAVRTASAAAISEAVLHLVIAADSVAAAVDSAAVLPEPVAAAAPPASAVA